MKFTSEDLMKVMGLAIGDRIKEPNGAILELYRDTAQKPHWKVIESKPGVMPFNMIAFEYIYDTEYEILPRPKRVGDLRCNKQECEKCYLRCLPFCNQYNYSKKTLYSVLNEWNQYNNFDQEIHDLLKARLDKEVE